MVKEYIEREAARLAYESSLKNDTHRTEEASRIHAQEHRHILHVLDKIPAADVVEVVRCKDCKHFFHYGKTSLLIDGKNIKAGWCQRRTRYDEEYRMTQDDFCSYGERRNNDATD